LKTSSARFGSRAAAEVRDLAVAVGLVAQLRSRQHPQALNDLYSLRLALVAVALPT